MIFWSLPFKLVFVTKGPHVHIAVFYWLAFFHLNYRHLYSMCKTYSSLKYDVMRLSSMCSLWEIFAQINTNCTSTGSNFKLLGSLMSYISIRVLSISAVENSHILNLLLELIVQSSLIQLGGMSKDVLITHIRKNRRARRSAIALKIWVRTRMTRKYVVNSRRNPLSSETAYSNND